ncbi:hypothetical protein WMF31_08785 [Sorangium sp. So ce1036]|uniref:hypothetical protein n=1 Tax=Sorangium sp. So ce1036 TaxID=3133328 RepID=UPI003F08CCEC
MNINEHEREMPLELGPDGPRLMMSALDASEIGKATELHIISGNLDSRSSAQGLGERIRNALLMSSLGLRMGFDVEDRGGSLAQALVDEFLRRDGIRREWDRNGVSVFEESPPVAWIRMGGTAMTSRKAEDFVPEFNRSFELAERGLSPSESLALELYSRTFWEGSSRSKIILYATIVEVLSGGAPLGVWGQRLADDFCRKVEEQQTDGGEDHDDKVAILDALRHLRRKSVTKATAGLVRQLLGGEAAARFQSWYNLRGQLVHSGRPKKADVDLAAESSQMGQLIANLLSVVVGLKAS